MNRRDFLVIFGLALLDFMSNTCGSAIQTSATVIKKKRIVVIGAGLAGLAVARELHRHGHDVVVVEARDRIGGRIWTSTQWPGMPLDLGASWIHGVNANPLTYLANSIQANRVITQYDSAVTYNSSGQALSELEEQRITMLRRQVFGALSAAQDRAKDISIQRAVASVLHNYDEDPEAQQFINFILSSEIEQEYSGSTTKLSSHWYDSGKEFKGDDALFVDGFRVVTEYLSNGLNIELGQVVQEVQWGRPQVRVVTQKAEFTADQAVVTLPLGVLQAQKVQFSPRLPRNKQNAIAKLGMGVLNKCYLRFQDTFWPADVDWLEYVPTKHGEWTEWVSFKQAANLPVLLGFNAADRGKEIESLSDQQIVASAMQTLKTIFGIAIPEPVDYQITRWASDPFALGSYSYNAAGSTPNMRRVLAVPLRKKLFFAGEASHKDYFGTAHGAYLSGLRVAKEILTS